MRTKPNSFSCSRFCVYYLGGGLFHSSLPHIRMVCPDNDNVIHSYIILTPDQLNFTKVCQLSHNSHTPCVFVYYSEFSDMYPCIAFSCNTRQCKDHLHLKDKNILQKWLKAIHPTPLNKHASFCLDHFIPENYKRELRTLFCIVYT